MPTVTGTLHTILNDAPNVGKVEVALCGYGSQVPRINAQGLGARVTDDNVTISSNGTFTFQVDGNDLIVPAGTYYTVTVKDDNGDIVQVNAYRFSSETSSYDLNQINPYDPNLPPPPLPVPIIYQLQIVNLTGSSWDCDGADFLSFKITATQNGLVNIQSAVPGNLYTFIVQQDATGGHQINWANGITNATFVDQRVNATTVQTFVCDENQVLWAIGPGTSYL